MRIKGSWLCQRKISPRFLFGQVFSKWENVFAWLSDLHGEGIHLFFSPFFLWWELLRGAFCPYGGGFPWPPSASKCFIDQVWLWNRRFVVRCCGDAPCETIWHSRCGVGPRLPLEFEALRATSRPTYFSAGATGVGKFSPLGHNIPLWQAALILCSIGLVGYDLSSFVLPLSKRLWGLKSRGSGDGVPRPFFKTERRKSSIVFAAFYLSASSQLNEFAALSKTQMRHVGRARVSSGKCLFKKRPNTFPNHPFLNWCFPFFVNMSEQTFFRSNLPVAFNFVCVEKVLSSEM